MPTIPRSKYPDLGKLEELINKWSKAEPEMRDYQFDIYMDTVWVYDQSRYVGKYIITNKSQSCGMDSLIVNDNQ